MPHAAEREQFKEKKSRLGPASGTLRFLLVGFCAGRGERRICIRNHHKRCKRLSCLAVDPGIWEAKAMRGWNFPCLRVIHRCFKTAEQFVPLAADVSFLTFSFGVGACMLVDATLPQETYGAGANEEGDSNAGERRRPGGSVRYWSLWRRYEV